MRIACTYCPQGPIEIEAEQTVAECPGCHRSFRLLTRRIAAASSQGIPSGQYRYRLTTIEPLGGERRRTVIAQGGLPFAAGALVTLAYRGSRLVGVADQERMSWHPVDPVQPRSTRRAEFAGYLAAVVAVITLIEAARFALELGRAPAEALVGAAVIALALMTTPLLLRAARHAGGDPHPAAPPSGGGEEQAE